jgi:hypothetical protein
MTAFIWKDLLFPYGSTGLTIIVCTLIYSSPYLIEMSLRTIFVKQSDCRNQGCRKLTSVILHGPRRAINFSDDIGEFHGLTSDTSG